MSSAGAAESSSAASENIAFTVKSTNDNKHQLELPPSTTILAVKEALATKADIPVDRQRLIYSGKVMKNEETLEFYKVKPGTTIHLVKGAASNPTPAASNARPNIPTNIASGTANNPLAGLTGARYAGQVQLPSAEMFGPDGGMMPNPDEMANMMDRPEFRQGMQMLLDNPEMMEQVLGSSPLFRQMPGAREMLRSPEVRQMLLNPDFLRQMTQMNRAFGGGAANSNPALNPFTAPLAAARNAETGAAGAAGGTATGAAPQAGQAGQPPVNPFAALFGAPPGGAGANPWAPPAAGAATGAAGANPFGAPWVGGQREPTDEEILQQIRMMRSMGLLSPQNNPLLGQLGGLGGFGGLGAFGAGAGAAGSPTSPPAPADTRPPEERFQDQLRQLNDMGFTDAQRNIQALLRSGGNVQGAVEQLLGG